MGIIEDREEFNNSALRILVKGLRKEQKLGYVVETEDGWRGYVVSTRPPLGTSSFLYVKPGFPVMRYKNNELNEQPVEFSEYV